MPRALLLIGALAAASAAAASFGGPAQDYTLYCMGCHGPQAQGVPGKIPPLAGTLARFMRTAEGRNYVLRVPGAANSALPDRQLTAVLNWLAVEFRVPEEAAPAPFTEQELASVRHVPLANVRTTRAEVVRALAASGPAPAATY
jgi:mono/diheme cytochrome c family protein